MSALASSCTFHVSVSGDDGPDRFRTRRSLVRDRGRLTSPSVAATARPLKICSCGNAVVDGRGLTKRRLIGSARACYAAETDRVSTSMLGV